MSNLRKITERVLKDRKIDLITPKEFHAALGEIFSEMLIAAPKRTGALQAEMAIREITALDAANLLDLTNAMAKDMAALKLALGVAVSHLYVREPGDSRAVSDIFIALACVEAGDVDQKVLDVLHAERERLDSIDLDDIRMENADNIKLSIRIGRGPDTYPLPPDVLDNKSVAAIIGFLKETPSEELRFLSKPALKKVIGADAIDAELDLALAALAGDELSILKPVWMFTDPDTQEEHVLTDQDRRMVTDTKLFIHPETGMEVLNYQDHIGNYWALNADNAEFLEWKGQAESQSFSP